ncbi:RNA pyrophosphohydrolase [Gammaproteobacteria bacterium]|nr:RNA pyrophosphohydrolase [Gammaproteobacteria bacterium]
MIDENGYRKNVGIILCNSKNELLICKRFRENSWQFPQGGFEENESAESAMYRELFEEIGLSKKDVEILGKTKNWLKYDLPKKYQRRTNNRLCVGQKQIWFLLKLITNESSINLLKSKKPEFDAWEWSSITKPLEIVINFKKNVYKSALEELLPIIKN